MRFISHRNHRKHRNLVVRVTELIEVIAIFLTVERRTIFVDAFKFTVAHDGGIGVIDLERSQQGDDGCTLLRCSGIGSATFLIQASLIADAY